jgi:hypothetical protein
MPKFNLGGAASTGLQDASTGASIAGVPGAIVGGVEGILRGGFSGGGTKEGFQKLPPPYNKRQENILSMIEKKYGQIAPEALDYIRNLIDQNPEALQAFIEPYQREFSEEIVPGLAERFTGLGAGAQKSSAFAQALSSAGGKLQSDLANLKASLSMKGLDYLNQFGQTALNPRIQYERQGATPSPTMAGAQGFLSQPGALDPLTNLDWNGYFNKTPAPQNPSPRTQGFGLPNFQSNPQGFGGNQYLWQP